MLRAVFRALCVDVAGSGASGSSPAAHINTCMVPCACGRAPRGRAQVAANTDWRERDSAGTCPVARAKAVSVALRLLLMGLPCGGCRCITAAGSAVGPARAPCAASRMRLLPLLLLCAPAVACVPLRGGWGRSAPPMDVPARLLPQRAAAGAGPLCPPPSIRRAATTAAHRGAGRAPQLFRAFLAHLPTSIVWSELKLSRRLPTPSGSSSSSSGRPGWRALPVAFSTAAGTPPIPAAVMVVVL